LKDSTLLSFAPILAFLAVGLVFILFNLVMGWVLRPSKPYEEKLKPYECGEEPVGGAWVQFNIRFYVVALIFILFEVEIAMTYPIAVVFKSFVEKGLGPLALAEVGTFMGILLLGLAYVWRKGDLGWVLPRSSASARNAKHIVDDKAEKAEKAEKAAEHAKSHSDPVPSGHHH